MARCRRLQQDLTSALYLAYHPDKRMNAAAASCRRASRPGDRCSTTWATLADPLRCRMLLVLERHELTVSELCTVLQLPQSTVSRHLKTLADAMWASSRRDGTSRYYSFSIDELDAGARRLWPLDSRTGGLDDGRGSGSSVVSRACWRAAGRNLKSSFRRRRGSGIGCATSSSGTSFHLHALLGLLDPPLVVADLGCGTGQLSRAGGAVCPHA